MLTKVEGIFIFYNLLSILILEINNDIFWIYKDDFNIKFVLNY